ncbi:MULTISPECIES: alpha/beta fold hydrolase [unclassified Achromobacter]|uniref:alpha/beta fold hydrolase n=1 Tax=unclassified Achromobacter TaxID=2626865 RepID=UPI000B51C170|nr:MULTISPECIES: alpha/beta hydrolase [unclassified Achromobacter]OWT74470.1 alpha/beta hydrolase [Achromobacter sp. HZ34]OWT78937.1 alpha/beta hydrolase [Achromobacter sp. HZ28]
MKLRSMVLSLSLAAGLFGASSTWAAGSSTSEATQEVKNIVLVHGLFADGSSWSKVIPLLQAKGLHVTAVQNPTTSLDDDVAAVKRALAQQDGPVILVGHSYGGMVISQAGDVPQVKGLVYIAARAPDAGEDYVALTKRFPAAPAGAGLTWSADGFGVLSEEAFIKDFANDLPKAEAEAYYAVQQPIGAAIKTAKTTVAAWKNKPTWYAVSTKDRTINTEQERFMAKRMNAHTIELDASHVALISQPEAVAKLILQTAHVPE